MKKYFKYGLFCLFTLFFFTINVKAETIKQEDIPNTTYVIGTHMFTRDMNEETGYEGKLTTQIIMLASKTVEGSNFNDMVIYYKNPRGNWINALTGASITVPDDFEIDYTNLSLLEENNTVSAPKSPIIYLDGPNSIDEETDEFVFSLNIFLDDMDVDNQKIDGVEVNRIVDGVVNRRELSYEEYFKKSKTTITEDFKNLNLVKNLVIGKTYHYNQLAYKIQSSTYLDISVRAYTLDQNGKKVYSEYSWSHKNPSNILPKLTLRNDYSNPNYISKEDGYYIYRIGIDMPTEYVFQINPNRFAYILYDENTQIGKFSLTEKVSLTIPENTVKTYTANLGYYDKNGNFVFYLNENEKALVIDTRKLTAPILDGNQEGMSASDLIDNGEYLRINKDFYQEQDKNSLDYNVTGAEIYEITYNIDGTKHYELVSDTYHVHIYPKNGHAMYVARVYAVNAVGEKVFSDFSNVIEVVRTPEIEVSEPADGKANIKILNVEQYGIAENIGYKVYTRSSTQGEVILGETDSIKDILNINIGSNIKEIYAKAYSTFGQELDSVYSGESNLIKF